MTLNGLPNLLSNAINLFPLIPGLIDQYLCRLRVEVKLEKSWGGYI